MSVKFWKELRRRQMYRLVGLYIVGVWLAIQVADIVFPAWGIPDSALRYMFFAAALCFPIALVFGWIFDIRRDGIYRTRKTGPDEIVETNLQRPDYAILTALLAVGLAILLGSAQQIRDEIESTPTAVERRANSIAVLPFDNLDTNPETGHFSDGVTEEILTRLSTLGVLHVIGRTSSFALRNAEEGPAQISELLGVRYLLHGSVRRDKDNVRVTARLIDEGGYQVWTQSFDRKLESIFVIQAEIASSVSSQIISEIVPLQALPAGRTTENMEAYNEYLIGKAFFDARSSSWQQAAQTAFRRAIELDDGFAPAYAGLAIALYVNMRGANLDEVKSMAERSLELDANLAEGHAILGLLLSKTEENYEQGTALLHRAIELDPTLATAYAWLASALMSQGLVEEHDVILEKGLEVDPLNPVLMGNAGWTHLRRGNQERAEQLFLRRTQVPEPDDFAYHDLAVFYNYTGRIDNTIYWRKQDWRANADFIRRQFDADETAAYINLDFAGHYLQLGLFKQAEDWHNFSRTVHVDVISDFLARAYLLLAQEKQSGLRAHLRTMAQHPELSSQDLPLQDLPWRDAKAELGMLNVIAGDFAVGIELLEPIMSVDIFGTYRDEAKILEMRKMHYLAYALRKVGRSSEATDLLLGGQAKIEKLVASGSHTLAETYECLAINSGLRDDKNGASQALQRAVELGWINYYQTVIDPLWAQAFRASDVQPLFGRVKAEIDRQRKAVEAAEATEDRAELEQLVRTNESE